MKRLMKDVSKAKYIWSDNNNYNLKVSELVDYVSLHVNINRKDLHDSSSSFFIEITEPVEDVYIQTGTTID